MGLYASYKRWIWRRRFVKFTNGLPPLSPVTPGMDWGGEKFPPTFGFTSKGKPYSGKPDVELSQKVNQILLGDSRIKNKKISEAKLVLTYADGEVQDLEKWSGPMRVLIDPLDKDIIVTIEKALFYKEPVQMETPCT
jgi:hypothetical protein